MNARWAAFDPWRGSQAANEPCAGARKPRRAMHAAETVAAASHIDDVAAERMG